MTHNEKLAFVALFALVMVLAGGMLVLASEVRRLDHQCIKAEPNLWQAV